MNKPSKALTNSNYQKELRIVKSHPLAFVCFGRLGSRLVLLCQLDLTRAVPFCGHVAGHVSGRFGRCFCLAERYFTGQGSGLVFRLSLFALVAGQRQFSSLGMVASLGIDCVDLSHARMARRSSVSQATSCAA